jgi:hypothetical protein
MSPSLALDELRRCAGALVLGSTGGAPAELPLAGILLVVVGSAMVRSSRRPVRAVLPG